MKKKPKWLRWLNILLAVYLAGGLILYFIQDYLLFHPQSMKVEEKYAFKVPHKEVNVTVNRESNMNIVQFKAKDSLSKGLVLYFHGNRKNIGWYAKYADNFTTNGYEVWMIDYPGFGKSTGTITEKKLYEDALQLYIMARSIYPAHQIIIYGKSMGTGVAAWLASKKSAKALILETPYYSMTSLAQHYIPVYPARSLLKYKLPTHTYISLVNAPVFIFHGTADRIIPYSNAHRLSEVMHAKDRFITVENAGHNNINDFTIFHTTLDSILLDSAKDKQEQGRAFKKN